MCDIPQSPQPQERMDFASMSEIAKVYFKKTSSMSPDQFSYMFQDNQTPEWMDDDCTPETFEQIVGNSAKFKFAKRKYDDVDQTQEQIVKQKFENTLKRKACYPVCMYGNGPISYEGGEFDKSNFSHFTCNCGCTPGKL